MVRGPPLTAVRMTAVRNRRDPSPRPRLIPLCIASRPADPKKAWQICYAPFAMPRPLRLAELAQQNRTDHVRFRAPLGALHDLADEELQRGRFARVVILDRLG